MSFTALGKGNGFNRCLTNTTVSEVLNAPSLTQTMKAYWNFKAGTFGSATFEPGNNPIDLICNETANRGSDISFDSSNNASFYVSHGVPFLCNGNIYGHGISFDYQASSTNANGDQTIIFVNYRSTIPSVAGDTYDCKTLSTGTPGGGSYSYGKSTSATKTLASTSTSIGGIPFVKTVSHEFYGERYDDPVGSGNANCITPIYLPEPSEQPSLSFH